MTDEDQPPQVRDRQPTGDQAFGRQPAGQQPYSQPPVWTTPPRPPGPPNNRRRAILGGAAAGLAAAGIVIAVIALSGHGKPSANTAGAASPAPTPGATAPTDTAAIATSAAPPATCPTAASLTGEPVGYQPCGTAARNVGVPTYDAARAHRTYTATLKTNRGDIVFTAAGADAPYTVFSFVYLAQKQYFDNTPCHRLTTSGIYVLQCGDPSGTGSGGPGYEFQDENLGAFGHAGSGGSVTYPAGTVAMANAGFDTNGSQFFLVYRDSPLAPDYTPFGTVTQGLDILTSVAAQGSNNADGAGDGAPVESVTIEQVTIS
jgi:peptidyl-prolyl cis-trans isomerase B (cyclophilin B)